MLRIPRSDYRAGSCFWPHRRVALSPRGRFWRQGLYPEVWKADIAMFLMCISVSELY
jgi:hypothetical protein